MFSKLFTTTLVALAAFTSILPASASPLESRGAVTVFTPKHLLGIEHAFQVITAIPDDVLESGDAATAAWLKTNGPTVQATTTDLALTGSDASTDGLVVVQGAWEVLQCVAAVTEFIVSGLLPAAKLLRLKKIISQLGGIRKAIEALIASKGNIAKAAALVKELFNIISGFGTVKSKCL